MSASAPVAVPRPAAAPATPALEWSFNPWRERPGTALLAVVLAAAGCVLVISFRESWILTAVLSSAIVASLAPSFTPARCRVGADGVARLGALGWTRRPWSDLRRARVGAQSVLLSPHTAPHWLDPQRAIVLPLPAANRDEILGPLRVALGEHGLG